MANTPKKPWVPFWETSLWQDQDLLKRHAPKEIQNWAFSSHQGIPIILEAKWNWVVDEETKKKTPRCDRATIRNYGNDLTIPWDVVKRAVDEARRDNISIKMAVARLIDLEDPTVPPIRYTNFALAPDVMVASVNSEEAAPTEKLKKQKADAFYAEIKKGTKKAPEPAKA